MRNVMKLKVNKAADVLSTAKIFQLLRSYQKNIKFVLFFMRISKWGRPFLHLLQKKVIKNIFLMFCFIISAFHYRGPGHSNVKILR
jgi:hypothetical protein